MVSELPHRRAVPDAPRVLSDVEGLQERCRRVAVGGEVVLGDEAVIEAQRLGILYLLHTPLKQSFPVPQVGIGPLVEETKLHICRTRLKNHAFCL